MLARLFAALAGRLATSEGKRAMVTEDPVGKEGTLIVATRGAEGPGEVQLRLHGTHETYLAHSTRPLPRGTHVLVVDQAGPRALRVESLDDPFDL